MPDISSIGSSQPHCPHSPFEPRGPIHREPSSPHPDAHGRIEPHEMKKTDRVELSDQARLSTMKEAASLDHTSRRGRVDEIRRQIAEGTYETPEKFNAALERLLAEL